MIRAVAALSPGARRALLTICTMTATIMQALDTTIANVALPYMQGSLSASLDQVSWVLTSYIVAAAVMTAPVGWLADRFGRKKLFIVCVGGFTVASLLCAVSQTIEQIVAFRLLQGMCGAALVPLSQSVMLDSYPIEQRGQAMGIWGVGIMLGPIMGPTLGGFLTENYSWHWVFLVNIPVGIVTVLGLLVFMDETKRQEHLRFDWFGFVALAAGIGGMQLMLDRGEQLGWFGSPEIVAELIVSIAGFYYFFAHSLTTNEPFVRFAVFRDRNFLIGCFFMMIMGLMLFSSMTLATPFLQNVLGYPILTAGWVMASRGLGTLIGMAIIGRLLRHFEARTLIFVGLALTAVTLYQMTGFTANTSEREIVVCGLVQGFGMGFVFIPLSTVAFLTLPAHLRTDGTSILTLVRNVASSVGISVVIANLSSKTTVFYSQLAERITPFNDALQNPDVTRWIDLATDQGRAIADQMLTLQAVDHGLRGRLCAVVRDLRRRDPVRVRNRIDGVAARRAGLSARSCAGDGLAEFLAHLVGVLAERRDAAVSSRLIADRRGRRIRHRSTRRLDFDAPQMRVRDQSRHVVDASERDVGGFQLSRQRRAIHRGERRRDLAIGFGPDFHAVRDRGKARIGGECRVAHHVFRQDAPLAVVLDRNQDVGAVPGLEHAVRRDRGMRQPQPLRRLTALVMQQRHRHPIRHRVEQRHGDRCALAGPAAPDDCLQHRLVGVHAGRDVGDRDADARRCVRRAGDRGEPALGLHQQVVGLAGCVWARSRRSPRSTRRSASDSRAATGRSRKPSLPIAPGFRFWMNTSALASSLSISALSSALVRSRTTDSLPRLSQTK